MAVPNLLDDLAGSWLLDALSDGVLLVDAGWRILFANRAAERLLHTRREEVVGKVVGVDLPEPPRERMDVYREVMTTRTPRVLREVALGTPELRGRIFEAEVHPSPTGGIAVVFRDVTERRRAEQAATRLGRILETSWNEIYIFDARSLRFLLVSRGALENLGYGIEELRELSVGDVAPEYAGEAASRLLRPLLEGEEERRIFETHHRRRDGSRYPVEVRLQLARSESPPVFIAVVLDITERRRAQEQLEAQAVEMEMLNEELRERTLELEEALSSRNRFYAAMSHELRTPINAIVGYNDLILAGIFGPLQPQQQEGIQRSQRAAQHLLEIVSDVLDISRLEAGKVVVHPEEVRLRPLLEDLAVTAGPLARGHGSELRVDLEGCDATLRTDPRHVRQILLNLVSNAAKFGAGEPVEVRCRAADGGGLTIEVVDRGEGIAPDDQERIFEEFVQLRTEDRAEGTGLGLPISRRLAERLGGGLDVVSAPGEGSTFRLTLRDCPADE